MEKGTRNTSSGNSKYHDNKSHIWPHSNSTISLICLYIRHQTDGYIIYYKQYYLPLTDRWRKPFLTKFKARLRLEVSALSPCISLSGRYFEKYCARLGSADVHFCIMLENDWESYCNSNVIKGTCTSPQIVEWRNVVNSPVCVNVQQGWYCYGDGEWYSRNRDQTVLLDVDAQSSRLRWSRGLVAECARGS